MPETLYHTAVLPTVTALALTFLPPAHAFAQSVTTADRPDLPPPGRLIDVGGYRLHVYCTGTRAPGGSTVVLSAGAETSQSTGDWSSPLLQSQRACAPTTALVLAGAILAPSQEHSSRKPRNSNCFLRMPVSSLPMSWSGTRWGRW